MRRNRQSQLDATETQSVAKATPKKKASTRKRRRSDTGKQQQQSKKKRPERKRYKPAKLGGARHLTKSEKRQYHRAVREEEFNKQFPAMKKLTGQQRVRAKTLWYTSVGLNRIACAIQTNFLNWAPVYIHQPDATERVDKMMDLYAFIQPIRAQILCTLRDGEDVSTYVTLSEHGNGVKVTINDPLALHNASGVQSVCVSLKKMFKTFGPPDKLAPLIFRKRRYTCMVYPKDWEQDKKQAIEAYRKLYTKVMKN